MCELAHVSARDHVPSRATAGLIKIQYTNRVPWLFARCDEIAVCVLIIEQTASHPAALHHRCTNSVMEPGSDICQAIHARAAGGPLTETLVSLKRSWECISFTDSLGGMPNGYTLLPDVVGCNRVC